MKIISVQFDYPGSKRYDILARVLEYSIKKNCPGAEFKLLRIEAPTSWRTKKCFASNTVKLQKWVDEMEATDQDIIFLDCDMIVLRDIADAFKMNFDVALTVNGTGSIPYNGGAVFVRNNDAGKRFIRMWNKYNLELYDNTQKHLKWRNKYAGMNQAALGYLLETNMIRQNELPQEHLLIQAGEGVRVRVKRLPCAIWNVCKNDWGHMHNGMYILHVKSALRSAVLDPRAAGMYARSFQAAIKTWRGMASEAGVIPPEGESHYVLPTFIPSSRTTTPGRTAPKVRAARRRRRWHTRVI